MNLERVTGYVLPFELYDNGSGRGLLARTDEVRAWLAREGARVLFMEFHGCTCASWCGWLYKFNRADEYFTVILM
jgi:hypothetical protein